MHKKCMKSFLDGFYCNNYMSIVCQTMSGLFSISLQQTHGQVPQSTL